MPLVTQFSLKKVFIHCPLTGIWKRLSSIRLVNGITQSFKAGRDSYPSIWQQHRAHCTCGSRAHQKICMDPNGAVTSRCTFKDVVSTLISMASASWKPGYLYKLQPCLNYQASPSLFSLSVNYIFLSAKRFLWFSFFCFLNKNYWRWSLKLIFIDL